MIDIERQIRRSKSIPLISLIDVVFQLLIYFMLTTSFTKSESLELLLPPTVAPPKQAVKKEDEKIIHIYISDIGETFIEQKSVSEKEMAEELRQTFTSEPERGVLVLSGGKVSVRVLVRVMDRIYTAGGKNIAVADWIIPAAQNKTGDKVNG